jgi:hypothetical protein
MAADDTEADATIDAAQQRPVMSFLFMRPPFIIKD